MARRTAALALASYSLAAGVVVLAGLPPGVAAVCVAPLVLFAPGCAIVLALRIPARHEFPARLLGLSVALSMSTTALGGLLINAVAPLTRASWAVGLIAFTVAVSSIALLQESRRPSPAGPVWRFTLSARPLAAGLLALVLLAGAATLTEINSRNAFDKPLTQLTLVPATGAKGGELRLSVTNLSDHLERLRLTVSGRRGVAKKTSLSLAASHSWSRLEPLGVHEVRASLAKLGSARPFSEVSWVPQHRPAPVAHARKARSHRRRASRSAAATTG